jgi:hypothetical protein
MIKLHNILSILTFISLVLCSLSMLTALPTLITLVPVALTLSLCVTGLHFVNLIGEKK